MKKKILLFNIILLILSCSSSNTNINKTNKSKISSKNSNQTNKNTQNKSESVIVEERMKSLLAEQDRIFISGTKSEIDRVFKELALLEIFKEWEGTKYILGGDSKDGIDCSAFVRLIYKNVFNKDIPRVSTDQANFGRKVLMKELQVGDILFFRPENRTNHTAVYLGNSLFLNASTSRGVIISSLESTYWRQYFIHGVRVIG